MKRWRNVSCASGYHSDPRIWWWTRIGDLKECRKCGRAVVVVFKTDCPGASFNKMWSQV